MENKKQTAVEWLKEQLVNMYNETDIMHPIRVLEFIEQAKEMDKQQRAELIVKMKSSQKVILYFNRIIAKSIRNSKK